MTFQTQTEEAHEHPLVDAIICHCLDNKRLACNTCLKAYSCEVLEMSGALCSLGSAYLVVAGNTCLGKVGCLKDWRLGPFLLVESSFDRALVLYHKIYQLMLSFEIFSCQEDFHRLGTFFQYD